MYSLLSTLNISVTEEMNISTIQLDFNLYNAVDQNCNFFRSTQCNIILLYSARIPDRSQPNFPKLNRR